MELGDIDIKTIERDDHIYTWPWDTHDLEDGKRLDDENSSLNRGKNEKISDPDEVSRTQPELIPRYVLKCIPVWCPDRNYLTNWEYHAYMIMKSEYVNYDETNQWHEKQLKTLWDLWFEEAYAEGMKSKKWQTVGFQGHNARTDFRGGGIVSLHCLNYFFRNFKSTKTEILNKNETFFFLACSGINLTLGLFKLLHLIDSNVPTAYREYAWSRVQFKNFFKLFSLDKTAFYELHSHCLVIFETLWHHIKTDSQPMPDFNRIMDMTIECASVILGKISHKI